MSPGGVPQQFSHTLHVFRSQSNVFSLPLSLSLSFSISSIPLSFSFTSSRALSNACVVYGVCERGREWEWERVREKRRERRRRVIIFPHTKLCLTNLKEWVFLTKTKTRSASKNTLIFWMKQLLKNLFNKNPNSYKSFHFWFFDILWLWQIIKNWRHHTISYFFIFFEYFCHFPFILIKSNYPGSLM